MRIPHPDRRKERKQQRQERAMKRAVILGVAWAVMIVTLGGCSIPIEGHERGERDRPDIHGGFDGYEGRR